MPVTIKIIYTSDTHGRLSAYDFISKTSGPFGLSRLSSYLKDCHEPYLLIDNGDMLQGSPLLDYARKNNLQGPVASVFNAMGYSYAVPGNHDFNFGQEHLRTFQDDFDGTILCANILKDGQPFFSPFAIHEIDGVRIAIIGVSTEYIPFWERKEYIDGLEFVDAVKAVNDIISTHKLKEAADVIVVSYHGGFEKDPGTGASFGAETVENKGFALSQIPEVDILLTGHQHVAQIHKGADGRIAMQTGFNSLDAGVIDIVFAGESGHRSLQSMEASLIPLGDFPADEDVESILKPLVEQTDAYLSEPLGHIKTDMTISDPLEARKCKHPLFQLINQIQLDLTGADISCASLPNHTHGFPQEVRRNDVAVSFPFENDIVVMELSGLQLRAALEQNAGYFTVVGGKLQVNPHFLHPKVEHYNYDVYDGISYEICPQAPNGEKISSLQVKGQALDDESLYTLALNSYRATGAGGFDMFKDAKILAKYPVSYYDLICEYISSHPDLSIELVDNFSVVVG